MAYVDDLLADRRAELKRVRDEKQELKAAHQKRLAVVQEREDALLALIAELQSFIDFRNTPA